jgi:hypothetical protein
MGRITRMLVVGTALFLLLSMVGATAAASTTAGAETTVESPDTVVLQQGDNSTISGNATSSGSDGGSGFFGIFDRILAFVIGAAEAIGFIAFFGGLTLYTIGPGGNYSRMGLAFAFKGMIVLIAVFGKETIVSILEWFGSGYIAPPF